MRLQWQEFFFSCMLCKKSQFPCGWTDTFNVIWNNHSLHILTGIYGWSGTYVWIIFFCASTYVLILITLSVEQKSIVNTDSWFLCKGCHWCTIDNWLKQNECYDLVKINNYTSRFLTLFFVVFLHLYFLKTKIWFSTLIFTKDKGVFFATVLTSGKNPTYFL